MENQVKTGNGQQEINGRRKFIGAAAAALFAGVVITVTGCSDDDKGTGPIGGGGDRIGEITNNHYHSAKITKAQLDAGGGLTIDIKGTSDHTHTLTLTAAQMTILKDKGQIHTGLVSSEGGSHTHVVMFM